MPAGDLGTLAPARRDLLVRTAAAEFAAAGYDGASLNKIIRACGMSKSSFYYVFASKEELFDLVVRDLTERLGELIHVPSATEFDGDRFWPRARALFEEFVAAAATDEAFTHLGRMFYLAPAPDAAHSAVATTLDAARSWLGEVLAAGRSGGAVRTDLPPDLQVSLLFAVLQAFDAWSVEHVGGLPASAQAELMRAQLASVRRLLSPDPAATGVR